MQRGRVNIVIDGQWGSTGKGKLGGYLANREHIDVAACFSSPNAGHTYINDTGEKVVFKQLPTACINQKAVIAMTPQCVIDVDRFLQEVEEVGCGDRTFVHPHAAIVTEKHKEEERANLNRISSTLQGTGAALSARVMRRQDAVAQDSKRLLPFIKDTSEIIHNSLRIGGTVLLEMSQGFDLSLTLGYKYPYVTSRDITTASGMNAAGVSPKLLGDVYGSLRVFPIRVGHAFREDGTKIGDSGPWYDDQEELSWERVTAIAGSPTPLSERTTVTNKVRRIFTLSHKQLSNFIRICGPNKIFLNFINYWDHNAFGVALWEDLSDTIQYRVRELQNILQELAAGEIGCPLPRICLLGTGPEDSQMVQVEN